jgi:hypothetical protein
MAGKRGLVMGVANDRSIAWGIARAVAAQGGQVAFTYQGEALEKRVRPLAESVGSRHVLPCDVTDDASVDAAFGALERDWGGLDFLGPRHRLRGQAVPARPLPRHAARRLPPGARRLLLQPSSRSASARCR